MARSNQLTVEKKMKSRVMTQALSTLLLAGISISAATAAHPYGWYIGAGAGQSLATIDEKRIRDDLMASGFTIRGFSEDDRAFGYKFLGAIASTSTWLWRAVILIWVNSTFEPRPLRTEATEASLNSTAGIWTSSACFRCPSEVRSSAGSVPTTARQARASPGLARSHRAGQAPVKGRPTTSLGLATSTASLTRWACVLRLSVIAWVTRSVTMAISI